MIEKLLDLLGLLPAVGKAGQYAAFHRMLEQGD